MTFRYFCILFFVCFTTALMAQNRNMSLVANLNDYGNYTDCWGYTDANGKDYALLGLSGGVSIVDISDQSNISEVVFVPWVQGGWYDMKTYQNYMYVSTESSNNFLVVDLANLPTSATIIGEFGNFATELHNNFVDTSAAILYAIEDFNFAKPVTMFSLADPANPVEIGSLAGIANDAHDVFAQNGRLYVAEGVRPTIAIIDVSDPLNPSLIERVTIPAAGYVHNVWATPDDSYMITTEETAGKSIKMWDIRDLSNVSITSEYIGESTLAHNVFIKGDYAYVSHYQSGAKILDISNPGIMIEVGNYDTINGENPVTFGNWGMYPYASNGLVVASDMATGLYVLEFNNTTAYKLSGSITDATTNATIEDAWVEIVETSTVSRTNADGVFRTGVGFADNLTLRVGAFGYEFQEIAFTSVPGNSDSITVSLNLSGRGNISGLIDDNNAQPLAGVEVGLVLESRFLSEPSVLTVTTGSDGIYNFADLAATDSIWTDYRVVAIEKDFPYTRRVVEEPVVLGGQTTTIDFNRQPADLLLVNDDPDGNFSAAYLDAIAASGAEAFEWLIQADGPDVPFSDVNQLQSPAIVWFSGAAGTTALNTAEIDGLKGFLDNGGKLLLSGADIAEGLGSSDPSFLATYFQSEYSGAAPNPPLIFPVGGNPITSGLVQFPASQQSRDAVTPLASSAAQSSFTYVGGPSAATILDNTTNGSKTALFGFGLEVITNTNTRNQLFANVLNWFSVISAIEPIGDALPGTFELAQNYPNPFNPTTTIRFEVGQRSPVSLTVYSALGQKVKSLLNETVNSGTFEVEWNGTDNNGNAVSSGVYFYRLESSGVAKSRKMILIR
ncbi:MAG: choice-of-anchor B family protein [Calditrichia bacterium]